MTFETFDQSDEEAWPDWKRPTYLPTYRLLFLAVHNSSIGHLVPWSVATNNKTLQSDPRDLWPLRHLIRVMKRHDLTKKICLPTYLPVHLPKSTPSRCDSRDLWPLWHLFRVMRWPDLSKKTLRCCDIWDTDYNTVNWEPEFMTIFVTWQLICDTGQHSQFLRCFNL